MKVRKTKNTTNKVHHDFAKIKFILSAIFVMGILLIAIFAKYIVPYDPNVQDLSIALQPPSSGHVLGTDRFGRDLLSRVIMGAQTSIFSTFALVMFISIFGTMVGIFCGYKGGRLDSFIMRITDVFLAFPSIVFAIAVAGVLGGGIINAVIALAVVSWPKYARLSRGQVLSIISMPYIDAAKFSGCGTFKMIFFQILPNIVGPILVTAALDIGTMMMEIAGLSFLGLGAQPPIAEWGSMMSNGRSMIQTSPWVVLGPGFAIFITVALFNFFGDATRDMLDPRRNEI